MDWKKIKAEYIAGGTSYRRLAEKYGVSFNTLKTHAVEEQWYKSRQQANKKATTKIIDVVSDKQAKQANKIIDVADKLLNKIAEVIDMVDTTAGIKDLSTAIKNIKEIKGIKSSADMREQEARIRNLEKQAERTEESNDITITISGDLDIYSK